MDCCAQQVLEGNSILVFVYSDVIVTMTTTTTMTMTSRFSQPPQFNRQLWPFGTFGCPLTIKEDGEFPANFRPCKFLHIAPSAIMHDEREACR